MHNSESLSEDVFSLKKAIWLCITADFIIIYCTGNLLQTNTQILTEGNVAEFCKKTIHDSERTLYCSTALTSATPSSY